MTDHQPEGDKPRLLVLASTYPRWRNDHEPSFVHELSRRLVDAFEVTVICPAAPGTMSHENMDSVRIKRFQYAPSRWQTLVNDGGITTNLKRHPWKYLLLPSFALAMFLALIREIRCREPEIIHAHWILPQGLVSLLASKMTRCKVPLVVTSHGADLYAWRGSVFTWLKRWVVGNAAAMTVVSRAMADEILSLGVKAQVIRVAPMGVDLEKRFTADKHASRSPNQILFVGRLVEKKGLRFLISAMPGIRARVPGGHLVIAGFGPEESECKRQVKELGLTECVTFLGPVPQSDLPGLYRKAAVFVAPFIEATDGDREGLGLVTVEAAACGCPVVVSHLPAVRDVFGPDEATFVEPGNSEALAMAVASVLEGKLSAPLPDRSTLMARFGWEAVAGRYARVLRMAAETDR